MSNSSTFGAAEASSSPISCAVWRSARNSLIAFFPMATEWSERRVGDVVIVDVVGALTVGTQHLREHFTTLYERGAKKIVINLAEVPYMDSTSVGDLIVGHLQAKENDAVFKLVNLQPKIVDLLTMHHLIQVFDHYEDEESALASFA